VSYALGAFLAGLILGSSEYAQQMTADLIPFRDVFSGVFFVAMGMLLDPAYVVRAWPGILMMLGIILIGKTAITGAAVGWSGYPLPVALQVGINLAQVGEFSFLIALMGVRSGLISQEDYQVAIAASIISMVLTPLATRVSSRLAWGAARAAGGLLPSWERLAETHEGPEPQAPDGPPLENHIVILGYGTVGRTIGEFLLAGRIPFVGVEIDPNLVREARRAGHPVRYGDVGSEELLRRAGVARARTLLVTVPEHVLARSVIKRARKLNPHLFILARGRRGTEYAQLYRDGADEVVHETFEVGVEFLARILRRLSFSKQEIERQIGRLRGGRYEVFRRRDFTPLALGDVRRALDTMRVEFLEIPEGSPLVGRSLKDAGIREMTGALVLAVVRDGHIVPSPEAWYVLQVKDTILVSGASEQVAQVETLLEPPPAAEPRA
jgi:CPA2 family monovalent cation:H+ antiporter-2